MNPSNVRISIDGEVVMDGLLDTWVATPPDVFKDVLDPGATPKPWLKAIMIAMLDAVQTGINVNIDVTTGYGQWSMTVVEVS